MAASSDSIITIQSQIRDQARMLRQPAGCNPGTLARRGHVGGDHLEAALRFFLIGGEVRKPVFGPFPGLARLHPTGGTK